MASPPINAESVLQQGFRFEPKPRDIVTYYLPRLIAGEPMHAALRPFLHAADIYACEPGALAAQFRPTPVNGDRFFFTAAKRQKHYKPGEEARYVRAAGPGSWSFQKGEEVRDAASNAKVGEVRKLRYVCRGGVKTDWLMEEYSCACTLLKGALVGLSERVFCRIYVSPNAGKDSVARQESAGFMAPPQPVFMIAPAASKRPAPPEPIVMAPAGSKRPAPLIVKPPCPKRIRGAPVSPRGPPPAGSGCTTLFPSARTSSSEQVQITRRPSMPVTPPMPSQQPRSSVAGTCTPQRAMMHPGLSPAPAPPRPSQQQAHPPPPAACATSFLPSPQTCTPRGGMVPSSSATPPMMTQPGRSPAPAPPRPSQCHSQQQASLLPKSSMARQLPPRPAAPSAAAPPVEQAPLTPRPGPATSAARFFPVPSASPDHLLSTKDTAEPEGDDDYDDLINYIESSLPKTEVDDSDDMDQFASSLGDILDVNEEGQQQVVPPRQKEAHKCVDPFEAAWADEAE